MRLRVGLKAERDGNKEQKSGAEIGAATRVVMTTRLRSSPPHQEMRQKRSQRLRRLLGRPKQRWRLPLSFLTPPAAAATATAETDPAAPCPAAAPRPNAARQPVVPPQQAAAAARSESALSHAVMSQPAPYSTKKQEAQLPTPAPAVFVRPDTRSGPLSSQEHAELNSSVATTAIQHSLSFDSNSEFESQSYNPDLFSSPPHLKKKITECK